LLNNFEEFATATVAQARSQLDELQPDFKTRKMSLIHRTRFRQALNTMLERDDPIEAFIETWALSVRITNHFKDGEGKNIFGEHQHIAVTSSEKLQTEIERIGKILLKNKTYVETQSKINKFAQTNPITKNFSNTILFVTKIKPGEQGLFDDVISLPLAPFKAMTGVDRTASAIYGLRDSADRIADVAEELPESARWQLLLLLMEMEETKIVKTFLERMSEFSQSSARIADSTEKLPEQLREQLSILVEEIDTKQASLQTTLDKAEKITATVERSLAKADEVADSFGRTADSVNEAAIAWEKSAEATNLALKEFGKLKPARKDSNSKASFNINDYRDTAETVTVAANELRTLTAEVREFVESDALAKYAFAVERCTNHLAWRIVQLLLLVFVLALVYKIVVKRHSAFRRPA
jgi:methyl-accepting chemotaxis protein